MIKNDQGVFLKKGEVVFAEFFTGSKSIPAGRYLFLGNEDNIAFNWTNLINDKKVFIREATDQESRVFVLKYKCGIDVLKLGDNEPTGYHS